MFRDRKEKKINKRKKNICIITYSIWILLYIERFFTIVCCSFSIRVYFGGHWKRYCIRASNHYVNSFREPTSQPYLLLFIFFHSYAFDEGLVYTVDFSWKKYWKIIFLCFLQSFAGRVDINKFLAKGNF